MCESKKFTSIVNLGKHPLVNRLVEKKNLGFGDRSWRYAVLVDNCKIVESFIEPDFQDNYENDPYEMSSPQVILEYLKENEKVAV